MNEWTFEEVGTAEDNAKLPQPNYEKGDKAWIFEPMSGKKISLKNNFIRAEDEKKLTSEELRDYVHGSLWEIINDKWYIKGSYHTPFTMMSVEGIKKIGEIIK